MKNMFKLEKRGTFLLLSLTGALRCLLNALVDVRKFCVSSTEERHGLGAEVWEI